MNFLLWLIATPVLVGSIVLIAWSIEHFNLGPYAP